MIEKSGSPVLISSPPNDVNPSQPLPKGGMRKGWGLACVRSPVYISLQKLTRCIDVYLSRWTVGRAEAFYALLRKVF